MGLPDLSRTVVVLDLDDTLYFEADYHTSGIVEVCAWISRVLGRTVEPAGLDHDGGCDVDLLGLICRAAQLPLSVKQSLLWVYRLHLPNISLDKRTRDVVQRLERMSSAVVILTDGRAISQRQKLRALKLDHLPAYISEEYGSEKPDPLRFLKIVADHPAESYVYIGDNPKKDFVAPNALNWETFCVRACDRNIHSQDCTDLPLQHLPRIWIDELEELFSHYSFPYPGR